MPNKFKVQDGIQFADGTTQTSIGNYRFDNNILKTYPSSNPAYPGMSGLIQIGDGPNGAWSLDSEKGRMTWPQTGDAKLTPNGVLGVGLRRGDNGNANITSFSINNITNSSYEDATSSLFLTRTHAQNNTYISDFVSTVNNNEANETGNIVSRIKTKLVTTTPITGDIEFYNPTKILTLKANGNTKFEGAIEFSDGTTMTTAAAGGGSNLPADANGYLNNDGSGNLTWVAGNPAGSGSLPYSDVWVLSTKTNAFWTSYSLNGTIAPLYYFGQYPLTLTASNQPAYGKQMISGQKICVVNDAAIHSSVNYYGLVFEFPATPAVGDTWIPWHNSQTQLVNAGNFIVGKTYTISTTGNTNWTNIGAADNNINRTFIATGVGSGTGIAKTTIGVDRLILLPAAGQRVLTMAQSSITSFGAGSSNAAAYLDVISGSNPVCFIYAGVIDSTPTWVHAYF